METRGIAWVFFLGLLSAKVLTAVYTGEEERRRAEDVVQVRDPRIREPDKRLAFDSCYCGISQYTGKRSGDPPGNSTDSDLDRIIGGTVVPSQTKYPWMAWGGLTPTQMGCTGALINDRYVLTAAHCVFANRHATFYVTLGDLDRSTSSESRSIQITARAIPHPGYRYQGTTPIDNDIALMRLDTPVNWNAYPHIRPICLPSGPLSVAGQTVTIAGWGCTNVLGAVLGYTSTKLREATLQVVSDDVCRRTASAPNYNNFLCAQKTGSTICKGDSGGPLMFRTQIGYYRNVGINSFGSGFPSNGAGFTETGSRCSSHSPLPRPAPTHSSSFSHGSFLLQIT
ncbi:unnamed protein product [Darwinula stevensoni]|uniref:Peptidase S1 domain-containing protein n=1 Tax=Darwinula stevensoni TaxID=69355 RepID=A0A7R9A5R9_9CRUS|nr:unnamed protein product [Darwinula stevensoni]CAG0894960.1 unnamed protein product [Darwinula stevensoni]